MTVKVRIKNFQSIPEADLVIDGLTVITGGNDAGKSAVRRAIEGVYNNTPGHGFVRHGTEKCEVELTFDDHKVKWEKGPGCKPTYTLDDSKVLHPGRGVPEEVLDKGIHPIQAGNNSLWPQFAPQIKGVVFLLDQSGSTIAEAVADVERVGVLNDAMRVADKDLRSARSTLKVRRGDKIQLEQDLASFDGLDDVIQTTQDLEKIRAALLEKKREILALQDLRSRYDRIQGEVARWEPLAAVEVPAGEGHLEKIAREIAALSELRDRLESAKRGVVKYAGVDQLSPDIDYGDKLDKILKAIGVLNDLRTRRFRVLDEVSSSRDELDKGIEALARAQVEVDDLLLHIPECPTCGATSEGD